MNRSSISASGKICKSLFGAFTFFVLFAAGFTSCENFLKSEDVQAEIKNVIEYNNSPSYVINVEAITGTGEVKTPATHEVNKKVTDVFPIRFEAAEGHKFIRWEVQIKDIQAGEKPSDYVVFEDQTSLETNVTLLKGSSKPIVIRPICPPKLTYTFTQGSGALYPRDSSPEFTFSQKLSDECFGVAVPVENYISVSNIEEEDIQNYFNSPRVNGEKLIFRSNSSNGYIPITNNSQRSVSVKIAKDKIWYINTQYLEPIKVTLDEDIQVSFLINAETSAKTTIKYELQQKDEKPLGIFKVDGEELASKEYQYSVGQTVALRYKIPDGYTFAGWKFKKPTGEALSLDDISLTVSDDDYSNNLLQTTFAIENYNSEVIVVTPELYEPVKFNFSKASDDTGTFKVEKTQITQEDQAIDFGVGQTFAISYKVPAGYYFYDWDFKKTYKDSSGATKTEAVTKAELEELGIILAYDGDDDDTSYNSATRIAQMQVTIDEYTANEISVSPVCFKNLEVSFNMADSEKEYNRNSHLVLTFNEKIPAACVQKLNIKIPGMPKDKTAADYFDIAGATFDSTGKRLTIKAKSNSVEELLPLNADGINTITVTLLASDFYYEKKITEEKTIKIGLIIDTAFTYTINSKTENQTSILIKNEDGAPGIFKVNGQSCTNQRTKYSIGDKITLAYTLSEEEVERYYFAGWKITREYKDEEGNDQSLIVDINDVADLNLDFESDEVTNSDGSAIYSAAITLTNYTDDIITIEPSIPEIAYITITVDGEHGKFTPSKGQKTFRLGKANHLEFEADSDYAFIKWQLIDLNTNEDISNGFGENQMKILSNGNFDKDKVDFAVEYVPEDSNMNLCLRPVIAERPQIISNYPVNTSSVLKDSTIQVMFDYDMDPNSIYYTKEELTPLENNPDIQLLDQTVNGVKKYYGYKQIIRNDAGTITGYGDYTYKNILITNNRNGDNITKYYNAPVFDNPRTLSITVARISGTTNVSIPNYSQILVNIDRGFFYSSQEGVPVSMAGSKKWVYQVNNDTDKAGPNFVEIPVIKINNITLTRKTQVPGIDSAGNVTLAQIPYYQNNTFNLTMKVEDNNGGSGVGDSFTIVCKKEYDENFVKVTNGAVTKVGIDYPYTAAQTDYNGDCSGLKDQLASGVYSISFILRDKCGNETEWPKNSTDDPTYTDENQKLFICIDKTGPNISSITFDNNVNKEKVIKPVFDYSNFPDYQKAFFVFYYYNGSSYTYEKSVWINQGDSTEVSLNKQGTKYRVYAYFYDQLGNSSNFKGYYYPYTIPAKPKTVSVGTTPGTSATLSITKPDEGGCTAAQVQYRKKGDSNWIYGTTATLSSATGNATVNGLEKGFEYEFEVCSYDSASGKYGLPYKDANGNYPTFKTTPEKPAAIYTDFNAYTNKGTISWSAPASGNKSGYIVYCSTNSSFPATTATKTHKALASETSHTFTDLAAGTSYYAKVVSYYGDDTNISEYQYRSTYTKPNPPRSPTVTARTYNTLTVSWSAPASGNCNSYKVEYKLHSASSYTLAASGIAGTSYTITGLTGGAYYDIQVSAYYSNYSEPVSTTNWQTCPAPVTNVSATKVSDTSFKATWTLPSGNYDGIILYYNNSESSLNNMTGPSSTTTANSSTSTTNGLIWLSKTATSYTISNLTSKGQYYFRVETFIGSYNSSSRLKTNSSNIPCSLAFDAVSNLSCTRSDSSPTTATLTWTRPSVAYDGIKIYKDGTHIATVGNTATSYSLSGLTPNTTYTYKLETYKGSGTTRLWAETSTTFTTYSSPVSSSSLTVVSPTSITVSWTNPSSSYYDTVYIWSPTLSNNYWPSKTDTSYTITNLTPGTSYTFRVRTKNTNGELSSYTDKTIITSPAPVTGMGSWDTGTDWKTIYWTNPSNGNYTGLYLYYKKSTDSSYAYKTAITDKSTTQYKFTGLSAGTSYDFKIVTYYSSTSSTVGSDCILTHYTKPLAPTGFGASSRSGKSIWLYYTLPASGYERIDFYYKKNSSSSWTNAGDVKSKVGWWQELEYGYKYDFKLVSSYHGYTSSTSEVLSFTNPTTPTNFSVNTENGWWKLSWSGVGDQKYKVAYKKNSSSSWSYHDCGTSTYWNTNDQTMSTSEKYDFYVYSYMDYYNSSTVTSSSTSTITEWAPPPRIGRFTIASGGSGSSAYWYIKFYDWDNIGPKISSFDFYVKKSGQSTATYIGGSWDGTGTDSYKNTVLTGSYAYKRINKSDVAEGDLFYIVPYHTKNSSHYESPATLGVDRTWTGETYGMTTLVNMGIANYAQY